MKGLKSRRQAYDLLAAAAQEQWGWPELPPTARGERGKPFFPGEKGREFNLSHSGELALCALDSGPVGADIQVIRTWRPGLPGRVCSREERDWLESGGDFWLRFTQLWTLKECRVKQCGQGLIIPIRNIQIPLPREGERLLQAEGLWFCLYGGDGWRGAVCGQTRPPEEIRWISGRD